MNEGMNGQRGFFDGNPKMIFLFGLVAGIALSYLFGDLIGARGITVNNNAGVDEPVEQEPTVKPQGELAEVTDSDHVRGNLKKAKVVVVEYSDFECPFCERHHPTMQQIYESYGDDVAWVYRHFPLSFHPKAMPAALASECAAEQDKFWEFADAMFENQDKLDDDYYVEVAGDLGLNVSQFTDCFESAKYQDKVSADMASGRAAGVNGTPATFINGELVADGSGNSVGAAPLSTFTAIIDELL